METGSFLPLPSGGESMPPSRKAERETKAGQQKVPAGFRLISGAEHL